MLEHIFNFFQVSPAVYEAPGERTGFPDWIHYFSLGLIIKSSTKDKHISTLSKVIILKQIIIIKKEL